MKTTLTISIKDLENIIQTAKNHLEYDNNVCDCLEIEVIKKAKYHNYSDTIHVSMQSSYAECNSKFIWQNTNR